MPTLASGAILQEVLLDSDALGSAIVLYGYFFSLLLVTFINIYSIDEYEHKNNLQTYFSFKRKMFFIFSYTKSKTNIAKKTFILECIGYFVSLVVISVFIVSLWLPVNIAHILWLVLLLCIVVPYCSVVAAMYHKIRELEKKNFKIDYGDDDEDE